jgi:hypothetical protein
MVNKIICYGLIKMFSTLASCVFLILTSFFFNFNNYYETNNDAGGDDDNFNSLFYRADSTALVAIIIIISKSLQKYLEATPGQHSINSLQKTAIQGTSHIIRKVLQAET